MCLHYIHKHPQPTILTDCHLNNDTSRYLVSEVLDCRTAVNYEWKRLCRLQKEGHWRNSRASRIWVKVASLPENGRLHMTVTFGVSFYWVHVLGIMEFSIIFKCFKILYYLIFQKTLLCVLHYIVQWICSSMLEKPSIRYQGDWISFKWNKFSHSEDRGSKFLQKVGGGGTLYYTV